MFRGVVIASSALLAMAQFNPQISNPPNYCVFSLQGATYDLSSLMGQAYTIQDNRGNSDQVPWSYVVSVCGDMTPPIGSFNGGAVVNCTQTCNDKAPGIQNQCSMANGPAFQVCSQPQNCQQICHRLGDTYANQQVLVDPFNPSHGLTVNYSNGDMCSLQLSNGYTMQRARSIALNFRCFDVGGLLPNQDMVNEDVTCGYNAMIFSKMGCPTECQTPSTSGHLCNGHGICDYDTTQSVARCFCDTNWAGHHCYEQGNAGLPPQQSYAGNIAGGFFGGIFTGLALVAIWGFVLSKRRGVSFLEGFYGIFGGGAGTYARAPAHDGATAVFDYPAKEEAPAPSGFYVPPSSDNQGPLLA